MALINLPPSFKVSGPNRPAPKHSPPKSVQHYPKTAFPISLRAKLLIGFSFVFSVVFAGTFYWFYTFTTEKTLSRLRTTMEATLTGAVEGVDVDELIDLYHEGEPNPEGFSDDPRYLNQLEWFQTVHSIEPRAWLYSFVIDKSENNRRIGESPAKAGNLEIIYLVDLWAIEDPSKAARFLEPGIPGATPREAILSGRLVEEPGIYTDKWGSWMSAFAPLYDENGDIVAGIGLDIDAQYVFEVQDAIRNRVWLSFGITYGVLFLLIYALSGMLTNHLTEFTNSAERIGAGNYGLPLSLLKQSVFPDEMDRLAQVFQTMVENIRTREQIIRESKRIEDEIRHALKEEREINELKSRFVSMVSHELRTPLTIIRTSAELLEKYGHLASEQKKEEYYNRIRAAVSNMTQLLEDVLTFGKAEAGKLEFNPTHVNLEHFCGEIVEEMRMGIGIGYTIEYQKQGQCNQAYLDPALLRSILTNLLSNAIKYSDPGSTVNFTLFCDEGTAIFEIQDHGIGIPREDQPRLFELFHRASNATTIRGTGLGLAIVKQCVAHHQGQVRFKSQEGKGTTFTVQLPIQAMQEHSDGQ
jgi:signal transduction histidine kinase